MRMFAYLIPLFAFVMAGLAEAKPVRNEPFLKTVYLSTPSGSGSGVSYGSAKSMSDDADLMVIQPGMVIENVYVIVDEAVTGVSAIDIGDDDSANGFVPTASISLATPGVYAWNSTAKGSYLKDASSNPAAKYYSASGKEVKLDATGTWTAGKVRVVIQGFNHAYP